MRTASGAQARARALGAAGISLLLACGGESLQGPEGPDGQPKAGLILSEPQATPDGSIAFASLGSGAAPGGLAAHITNLSADTAVGVQMFDGGFDPVAIPGEDGDTIRVDVDGGAGGPSFVDVLKRGKPPVVVRAGPTRGAMDVSLNASIVVVWSTPMRPETINPTTVTLVLGGDTIPATVQLSGDRLRAEVRPSDLLPSREYTLVVSGQVASNTGKPMATEYRTVFQTVVLPTVTRVTLTAESDSAELGQPAQLAVAVLDSAGNPLEGRRVVWSVSGAATVSDAGQAMFRAPGAATFTAAVEGVTGSVTLRANPLRFREVAAGDHFTCGVTVAGFGYCWGRNGEQQLGDGTGAWRQEPTAVVGGMRFQTIATGGGAACAIALDGRGYCWGATGWNDQSTTSARPMALWSPMTYSAMSLGNHRMCAVDGDGTTICSGHQYLPALPLDWDETDAHAFYIGPVPWFTEYPLRSLAVGDGHTCGLSDSGVATCWGLNIVGQLGDGTTTTRDDVITETVWEPALTQVDTDVPFVSITAGKNHTCALDAGGRAYCWGDNRNGELGSALTGDCDGWNQAGPEPSCQARPVPVGTSLTFRVLAAGTSFTCGLTADGQAYCWGLGNVGQLGAGSRASAKTGPVPVAGGLRFAALSAGTNHVCGVSVEGLAYCWGGGAQGQLGTGLVTDGLEPGEVKLQANP